MISPTIPAMVAPMTLDTVWLSYSELADRLGIAPESARNLVRRREWPRKPGNDGTQRIGVPQDYLDERAREQAAEPPIEATIILPIEAPVTEAIEGATVAALEAHIATLKGVVDHERQRADVERQRADAEKGRADLVLSELAQLRERAEQEQAKARMLAVELTEARERAEAEAVKSMALMSESAEARAESQHKVAGVERDVAALRSILDGMRRPAVEQPVAPAWLRWITTARAGRAS